MGKDLLGMMNYIVNISYEHFYRAPTLSRGIRRSSAPCLRKTLPVRHRWYDFVGVFPRHVRSCVFLQERAVLTETIYKNRRNLPALCCGLMPTPSLVMIALVAAGTLNSSAANFSTAVKGAFSGTFILGQTTNVFSLDCKVFHC